MGGATASGRRSRLSGGLNQDPSGTKAHQVEGANAQLDSTLKLSEGTRLVSQVLTDVQQVLTVPVGDMKTRCGYQGDSSRWEQQTLTCRFGSLFEL